MQFRHTGFCSSHLTFRVRHVLHPCDRILDVLSLASFCGAPMAEGCCMGLFMKYDEHTPEQFASIGVLCVVCYRSIFQYVVMQ